MRRPSPLNQLLKGLHSEGRFESTGQFTISRQKALEKLASFALPLPESWALCLVQFAVGAGASEIKFALRNDTIQFQAVLPKNWSFPDFQERLYELPTDLPKELEALLLAFWQTSFAQGRKVLFAPPSRPPYLLLNGTLEEMRGVSRTSLLVEVSHQRFDKKEQEKPALLNADILGLLSERAFVCPIPLLVDGRRMDQMLRETRATFIDAFDFPVMAPKIPVPRMGPSYRLNKAGRHQRQEDLDWPGESEVGGLCFVFLACLYAYQRQGTPADLELGHGQSSVNWLQNGILVDTGSVMIPHCRGFFFQVFLSAEGLSTDLSGQLIRDNKYKERRTKALSQVGEWLSSHDHGFEFVDLEPRKPRGSILSFLRIVFGERGLVKLSNSTLTTFSQNVDTEYDKARKFFFETYPPGS